MNKRKLMLVAVSLCMVAILGFGGTLAYLTDTDNQVNTFTTGNVQLNLDETKVHKDEDPASDTYGDYISDGVRTDEGQSYKVFPGNTILKDPKVTVLDGSEDAWVVVEINISGTDLYKLFGVDGYNNIDITTAVDGTPVFSGGLISETTEQQTYNGLWGYGNAKFFLYQQEYKEHNAWRLWLFMKAPMAANASEYLFTSVQIPDSWDNAEMTAFNNLTIDIKAYGIQADGFVDAYEAMATAFPTESEF